MSAFDTPVTAPTATPAAAPCSFDQFHSFLPSILQNIPQEWRGTTFKNSHLLGRELFSHNLCQLVSCKASFSPPQEITTQDLIDLGNAEDYLRVASNISCLLETYVALQKNYVISQVFTFASSNLSIISVLLTSSGIPVHLYLGDHGEESISPFTDEHLRMLSLLSADLHIHHTFPPSSPSSSPTAEAIILAYESNEMDMFQHPLVDGIIRNTTHGHGGHGGSDADADDGTHSHGSDGGGILYIKNIHKIIPSHILIIRKRLATPMTSPIAENLLYEFVHLQSPQSSFHYSSKDLESFQSHLQTLSGLPMNHNSLPICYTAGLPAICSLWMTLLAHGGADVVMASTSYGGSSELTDIFQSKAIHNLFNKYKFDITGTKNIHTAIESTLATLSSLPSPSSSSSSSRTTVLFVEIPTNPDMKVPNILQLATILMNYQQTTSRPVLLLIDTTFAPGSQILSKIEKLFPHLPTMIFISMSKSISRGMTTAGTLISGSSNEACQLLQQVHTATAMFDTKAKSDQMKRLIENHVGVEERCQAAYQNACYLGKVLQDAVYELCGGRYEMSLAFVTKENAQDGFTSSTFSFNLPSISWTRPPSSSASSSTPSDAPADADGDMEINANLAQRFVTLLCEHTEEFKPCVSFGQDNGLVYATVPATSTQGAIHPDDKAKQAVGGVQLTRLSFPPSCDLGKLEVILKNALRDCYAIVG